MSIPLSGTAVFLENGVPQTGTGYIAMEIPSGRTHVVVDGIKSPDSKHATNIDVDNADKAPATLAQ